MARKATNSGPERIKRIIRERGLTYSALAQEIGVTVPAIYAIVNNRVEGATGRYAVAKALGMEVSDLWPRGESEPKAA